MRTVLFSLLTCAVLAADNSTLVDRVGATGFVQLEAESFKTLTVTAVTIGYPRDYVRQQLGYAAMYRVQ